MLIFLKLEEIICFYHKMNCLRIFLLMIWDCVLKQWILKSNMRTKHEKIKKFFECDILYFIYYKTILHFSQRQHRHCRSLLRRCGNPYFIHCLEGRKKSLVPRGFALDRIPDIRNDY